MPNYLRIQYCNRIFQDDCYDVIYKLRDHAVVNKWVEKMQHALNLFPIDDPGRFYGFNSPQLEEQYAINNINKCIQTINDFEPIIDRTLTSISDQDTLNYLHHIFEIYHGLLDQQTHEFWLRAPAPVRKALADLNLAVHRCESVNRHIGPRHVVTYYGMTKNCILADEDYLLFDQNIKFGTVYLNYAEIGKTIEDLATDNDQYIADNAFQPFRHYSADFNVKFWNTTHRQIEEKYAIVKEYYYKHESFFKQRDLNWEDPKLAIGQIPLADLETSDNDILSNLATHQWVKSITLI